MNRTILSTLFSLAAWLITPASAQPSSNTLVRFHFYHGTVTVGDVDVELFDYDKPVTVSNFLRYVRSGAYHNLLLNRCVPGFVIQGGGAWTPTPLSSSIFGAVPTPNFGPITNEFDVGPRLSNVFGTLAMARAIPSVASTNYDELVQATNSASSDWFFNLADNSSMLDTNWGGFTVFGRVVASTNALDYFNQPSPPLYILHLGGFFADLPITNPNHPCTTYGNCPRYNELYHVKISVLPITDTTPPTVTITSPGPGAKVTNSPIIVTGTATDDTGVTSIFYSIGGSAFTNAPGGAQWSIATEVPAGTNLIYLSSVDTAGQRSAATSRSFFFSVPEPLRLTNVGNGRVIGATNLQIFEINRHYTITAVPAPNYFFYGWSGSYLSSDGPGTFALATPKLTFNMLSNFTLTATFVTNPFAPLKGSYVGTVFNTNFFGFGALISDTLGSLTFSVTDQGRITGKARQGTGNYSFSGTCHASGVATISAPRPGKSPLEVRLVLDVTNRSDRVTGYVTDNVRWTSFVQAERAATGTLASPSRFAGRYTVVLPGGTNAALAPPGCGPAAVTVSSSARLNLLGNLADGTPVTHGTALTTNGNWPFYLPLYAGKGTLFSWAQFDTNQPNDDVQGIYLWLKHPPSSSKFYTNGFVVTNILTGSLYRAPVGNTNRVLQFTEGVVGLTDGNLPAPLTNGILFGANNIVTNLSTNKLALTIARPTGLFTGTVTPTNSTKAIPFKGAVLQKQNVGAGFFLGTNQSGRVYFGP